MSCCIILSVAPLVVACAVLITGFWLAVTSWGLCSLLFRLFAFANEQSSLFVQGSSTFSKIHQANFILYTIISYLLSCRVHTKSYRTSELSKLVPSVYCQCNPTLTVKVTPEQEKITRFFQDFTLNMMEHKSYSKQFKLQSNVQTEIHPELSTDGHADTKGKKSQNPPLRCSWWIQIKMPNNKAVRYFRKGNKEYMQYILCL